MLRSTLFSTPPTSLWPLSLLLLMLLLPLLLLATRLVAAGANATFDCKQFRWLHTPKTGSTFCLALQHVCCTEEFEQLAGNITLNMLVENERKKAELRPFSIKFAYGCAMLHVGKKNTCYIGGDHSPLSLKESTSSKQVLAFFREPKERLVSAYLDSIHHEGMPDDDYKSLQDRLQRISSSANKTKAYLETLIEKIQAFADEEDNIGCQVKMINGYQCADPLFKNQPFNASALQFALARMKEFYFVGLTDQFELSARLFHAVANHGTSPLPVELFAARTTSVEHRDHLLKRIDFSDPYDSVLYAEAARLFAARVQVYGLSLSGP